MRRTIFAPGEYYHIFGRGVLKQKIYKDNRDFARFLFLILYGQSAYPTKNVARHVSNFLKKETFGVSKKGIEEILLNRVVSLAAFTLMPNHFHLILHSIEEGGISRYMHRTLMAYAKYFNERYETSGHLFQGPFGAVHIADNRQLLHVSAYVHKNQNELSGWRLKGDQYPWSSYHDYVQENRWETLLDNEIIRGQFDDVKEYQHFVATSPAKELDQNE